LVFSNCKNNELKNKVLLPYSIIRFSQSFFIGIFLPIITLLQLDKGRSLFDVGIAAGIYSGTVLIFELPTGNLADLIGRKVVFILSLISLLFSSIVFTFSDSIIHFGIGFMLFGLYRAMASGSMEAWYVDELKYIDNKINLQKYIAIANTSASIGGIMGSVLCGIVPITFGIFLKSKFEVSVFSGNLIVLLLMNILLIFYVLRFTSERKVEIKTEGQPKIKELNNFIIETIQQGIKNKIILILLIATFIWGYCFAGVEFYWQPQIKNIMGANFKVWVLSIVSTAYFLFGFIGNISITRICLLFNNRYNRILLFLRLLLGFTLIILAFQSSLIPFIIIFLFLNLFASMHESPYKSIFNENIDSKRRSSVLSLESLIMESGGLIGVLIAGVISEYFSIRNAWCLSGVIFIISGFLYLKITNGKENLKNDQ